MADARGQSALALAGAAGHPSGDNRFKMLDATMKRHRFAPDALIEVLHTAQELFGFLQPDLLYYVAHDLKLPPSRVYGVATFYHFFTLRPKGEHTCVVCTGTACYVKGADRLLAAIEERLGISAGKTTADGRVSLDDGPVPRRLRPGSGRRLRRRGRRQPGARRGLERMKGWRRRWISTELAGDRREGASGRKPVGSAAARRPVACRRARRRERAAGRGRRAGRPGRDGPGRDGRLHAALLRGPAGPGRSRRPALRAGQAGGGRLDRRRAGRRTRSTARRGDPERPFFARQMSIVLENSGIDRAGADRVVHRGRRLSGALPRAARDEPGRGRRGGHAAAGCAAAAAPAIRPG